MVDTMPTTPSSPVAREAWAVIEDAMLLVSAKQAGLDPAGLVSATPEQMADVLSTILACALTAWGAQGKAVLSHLVTQAVLNRPDGGQEPPAGDAGPA